MNKKKTPKGHQLNSPINSQNNKKHFANNATNNFPNLPYLKGANITSAYNV